MSEPNLITQLLPRLDEVAAEVIGTCVAEIPGYQRLPAAVLSGDLVANARALIELQLHAVTEGRTPSEHELALPISWGSERARDGLPLDAVLRIYPIGARAVWRLAAESANATREQRELVDLFASTLDFLTAVLPQVATAYLRERQELDWEQREDRQSLASALIAGRPTAQRWADLAENYAVVVYRLPELPAGEDDRAATKLFRAIQARLDRESEVLSSFEHDRGVLLIPADTGPPRTRVAETLSILDEVVPAGTLAAAAVADGHIDIPRAHQEAADVLALAERLRRRTGLFWLPDLAIEYQLAQPGPARDCLAAMIEPLATKPHLLDALRAFVVTDYNRGEAATTLNIHRNTLNYRLGRIRKIIDLDPTKPEDARTLAAALTAYDIAADSI